MKPLHVPFLLGTVLLAYGCDETPPPLPEAQVVVLEATLDQLDATFDCPGIAFGVRDGEGRQWLGVRGTIDLDAPLLTTDVAFLGSVTKTVTTAVTLQLVEEGALELSDTIDAFGIDLPNAESITIEQLLGHRSGLFNYTDDAAFVDSFGAAPLAFADIYAVVNTHEPLFPPDTAWTYSNTNFTVLGDIIEQTTGQPLEDTYQNRIFGPLSMDDSGLGDRDPILGRLARGYRLEADGLRDVTFDHDKSGQGPDGALFSSLHDMLIWASTLYGGDLLEDATLEGMVAPRSADIVEPLAQAYGFETGDYGLGTIVLQDSELGPIWGHAGNIRGYGAYVGYVPSRALSVAFFCTDDAADGLVAARGIATALASLPE